MTELNDFYNDGFGWICKHCEQELVREKDASKMSRIFREGEAESKNPKLANPVLAKWMDKTRQTLICPRCGITEAVDKN